MNDNTISLKKTARLAGLLYLVFVISGIYGLMYIPSQTIVPGNAAATAGKMLANEFLFQTGIINGIISSTIWVMIALALYRLFYQVNEWSAKLMVALVMIQIPVFFIAEGLSITSLMIFKGEMLSSFPIDQRQDMAMLLLKINSRTNIVLEMFWGLWLFPFGQLAYQSKFIPRLLGILLILNGIAYVAHSFTALIFPDYQTLIQQLAMPFWIAGEVSIMLWLLIIGVKTK
ncbi:MAG: DUF4386 domain-containing protein [Saprospiraceae bacterium]|nr:DUF4386 domain-containing protein [Saprospiraceae bacterium]